MDKQTKLVILGGFFPILAAIVAYSLPIVLSGPNIEIVECSFGVDPNIDSNYSYTSLHFQVKNTGDKTAIINFIVIKILNFSIIDNSTKTSYPRLSEKDLPDNTHFIKLRTINDPQLMKKVGIRYGTKVYYPLPPQSSKEFYVLLDSDKTAIYKFIPYVYYDDCKEIQCGEIETYLDNVNTSLSDAYPTTIEQVN